MGAQFVSLVGNWMQELAKSWVVLQIVGQSTALAALLLASAIPNLLFGPLAGVLADKKNIKSILVVTQTLLSVVAFALGLLVTTGTVQLWHLVAFSLIEGTIIAFDLPAFNKITPTVVPREDFQQALALNAVNFHLSRVIGPSIAGIVIAIGGESSVFWLNSLSFLGIVFVISKIPQLSYKISQPVERQGLGTAWKYLRSDPLLSSVVMQLFLVIGLMFPLVFTVFRVYFQKRFHLEAQEFGIIFSAPGFGALMGSVTFLLWSPRNPLKALPVGITGIIIFLLTVSQVDSLVLATAALACFSYCMFLTISSLNVTIQLTIKNEIRGRVAALVGMGFTSLAPIMSIPVGFAADHYGEQRLMVSIAVIFGLGSTMLALLNRKRKISFASNTLSRREDPS